MIAVTENLVPVIWANELFVIQIVWIRSLRKSEILNAKKEAKIMRTKAPDPSTVRSTVIRLRVTDAEV